MLWSYLKRSADSLQLSVVIFLSRFGILPPNVSPLGSFGFFSRSPWLYLGSIIVFDVIKGGFYPGFLFTYGGFAMYWLLGRVASENKQLQFLLLPLASFLFFLISNIGSFWVAYPHTWQGLLTCLTAGLPFYSRTLLGDLVFGYGYLFLRNLPEVEGPRGGKKAWAWLRVRK